MRDVQHNEGQGHDHGDGLGHGDFIMAHVYNWSLLQRESDHRLSSALEMLLQCYKPILSEFFSLLINNQKFG